MENIVCPHCKKTFPLSEAVKHDYEERIRAEESEKIKEKLEKEKIQEIALERKKILEEKESENKIKDKKLDELENKLAKEQREREKIETKLKEDAKKEAHEEVQLKLKEKDITIDQIKKINEDLKRKLEQGSQQKQGEALELDLEQKLKQTFTYDRFLPVPKGVKGADIVQQVRNKFEKVASTIIWEFKRTKTWDKNWLPKLREDARVSNANESIIVSEVLPEGINVYGKVDGVWVTNMQYAIPLATILREMGIRIAVAKSGASHDDESLKKIHDYILSEGFRHKVEKDVETVGKSLEMLEKKHNVDEKFYRTQKSYLEALRNNTSQIYFDLQEIVPALPSIAGLDGELMDIDEDDNQETLI